MNHVFKIIIIIIIKKRKVGQNGREESVEREREREREREFYLFLFLSSIRSQIYENRTVGFRRG